MTIQPWLPRAAASAKGTSSLEIGHEDRVRHQIALTPEEELEFVGQRNNKEEKDSVKKILRRA